MKKWLLALWKSVSRFFIREQPQKSPKGKELVKKTPEIPFVLRPVKEVLNVQVGIDFGTHCSKVCYSLIGPSTKRFPVIFGHGLSSFPSFVMPSLAMFDDKQKILLGDHAGRILENEKWGYGLRNFKTLLANIDGNSFKDELSEEMFNGHIMDKKLDHRGVTPFIIVSVYIAYLVKVVKKYIHKQLNNENINFNFNICIPVDYLERNPIKKEFENSFALAIAVENEWDDRNASFDPVEKALFLKDSVKYDEYDPETRVFGIPESVAEVVSYLKSPIRQAGVHALIDFGSGTTDVSVFNFTMGIKEKSYWYSTGILPTGVFQVEKALLQFLENDTSNNFSTKAISEIITSLSKNLECEQKMGAFIKEEIGGLFGSRGYKDIWVEAYKHLKKESYWKDVKVLVSGGGSKLPYISDFASRPWTSQIPGRYSVDFLSRPDDFDTEADIPFYRMSVAYGLTWPKPTLRGYVLPKDAPDHTPPPLPKKEMSDREELYPK
jgi:hypothetical protein